MNILEIKNLHAEVEGRKILKGINLTIKAGEIHAIMGPNGSGKSTLCNVLMGHPKFKITKGKAFLNRKNILTLEPHKRAQLGLFLAFQHPLEIPGITMGNFLRNAKNILIRAKNKKAKLLSPTDFIPIIKKNIKLLQMTDEFINRSINDGFSGGEKKRAEIVQMSILEPKFALLDEIDSGLDIDALKAVAKGIKENHKKFNPGILLITHYQRILNYITPNFVHIISDGKIVKSGEKGLAKKLEKTGYKSYVKR